MTSVGGGPLLVASDGADLWVSNNGGGTVSRVRASDGMKLGDWTGAADARGVLVAMGEIFLTGELVFGSPGRLYEIDPTQPPGSVTLLSASLGVSPEGLAFDGQRIWTANFGTGVAGSGSVSIITPNPVSITTVTTGFGACRGIVYDGENMWVTDYLNHQLMKLDSSGGVLLSVNVPAGPQFPAFDGTNIWVPNHNANSVSVVRATGGAAGTVLATLTGNGLDAPTQVAFDGERMMVTNGNGNMVSLWKASDMTPIGTYSTGGITSPFGVCSDGLNFWITLRSNDKLARF